MAPIVTDYLVVGAGTAEMAFADARHASSDAEPSTANATRLLAGSGIAG
jgi:hypothetical protein